MNSFEKTLTNIINNNFTYQELTNYIQENIDSSQENKQILINNLPLIIKNTNDNNYKWLNNLSNYNKIPGFMNQFLKNIYLFNFNNVPFLNLILYLKKIPFNNEETKLLIETTITNRITTNLEDIYYFIKEKNPKIIPWMLEKFIQDEKICSKSINLFTKEIDNLYLPLLYENIDIILKNTTGKELFYLKDIVKQNKNIYQKVTQKIKEQTKENYIRWLKALYLKVVISHSYYHDLSYINEQKFTDILEIIYLIIEDVCTNEKVDITTVENIATGGYSSVLLAGNKVIKIGLKRATKTFPNNPYINVALLRKEFPITKTESLFVEVNEKVDTKSNITDEELYNLYKKIRELHLIWLDVEKRNVGRLLKDNKINWREHLPITDERLGLTTYRGTEILKKGNIVILDNDLIYDEKKYSPSNQYSTPLQKEFEKKYQKEKDFHKKVEN